ncbi:hypothetical protein ABZ471_39315 [Streptomyces sp. NPDC005728]
MKEINEAYDRVLASDVRYRFVIDASTLATPWARTPPAVPRTVRHR